MINQQKVLEVLRDAREILADEQRWTKNDFSLDTAGKPTNILGPDAARWCIMGAVIRAGATTSRIDEGTEALELLKAEVRRTTGDESEESTVVAWQDLPERTHPEVLALFDRVIKSLTPRLTCRT